MPSGLTLLTAALLVLLPAFAALQYRWVGQISLSERDRMQRNVRVAAIQFRGDFDGEIARAALTLHVGPATARDGGSERYSDTFDTWVNRAAYPQIVANVFIIDAEGSELRLRRWDVGTHTFVPAEWSAALAAWRPALQRDLEEFRSGRVPTRRNGFRDQEGLMAAPLRNRGPFQPGSRLEAVAPVFGLSVIELDLRFIKQQLLPELAQRHFTHPDGDAYRVAVVTNDEMRRVVFRSHQDAPSDPQRADAAEPLFEIRGPVFGRNNDGPPGGRHGPNADAPRVPGNNARDERPQGRESRTDRRDDDRGRGRDDDDSRWRMLVQHPSGSLEAAVAGVRRRNLAISFGTLLLLSVSVALLSLSSRRAQRLAKQQMEFVAGISHELRTPVAVIRSAAENLAQGVVGSADKVKRYGQMIEGESRRLGEMVERVLQYAGIESGLGLGTRAPLVAAEIIETAIDSTLPLLGPDTVTVHREIAPDLPPVLGDAAALRSAVQNLIANAVKYGGSDRWVGVRAEQTRERRRREIRITVTDHGDGIPASELPHIFEPFYRGTDAVARQIHGNGLGLSLVKRIVAAHGGRVTVTTRPGAGSAFTIVLPAAEADARTSAITGELGAPAHS